MNDSQSKFYRRNLPHYYIPCACYFVTYRLAGSLPLAKVVELKNEYEQANNFIEKQNNNKKTIQNIHYKNWKNYFKKIDDLLDNYLKSPRYLENDRIAEEVVSSLLFFDKVEFDLLTFCIMPNHVHIVFTLKENSRTLDKIMGSIKGYSANQINDILGRKGTFWQEESYDHIIRNECELERIVYYILNNPVKAGLVKNQNDWKWNYIAKAIPL